MVDIKAKVTKKPVQTSHDGGGAVYFFGGVGALVYYIQQADGFWPIILAVLKAIVWPGFLVYDLLKYIS